MIKKLTHELSGCAAERARWSSLHQVQGSGSGFHTCGSKPVRLTLETCLVSFVTASLAVYFSFAAEETQPRRYSVGTYALPSSERGVGNAEAGP